MDHPTFRYRMDLDVLVVNANWSLQTKDDVLNWYDEFRAYFAQHFNRKVDVIFDLTNFRISAKIASFFGPYRARMLNEFTNRTYRVNICGAAKTAMYTSAVYMNAPANDYPTIESAIAALLRDRERSAASTAVAPKHPT